MRSSRYGQFFATAGVPRLFGSTLVGRLPAGMLSLALVLRLTQGHRSYAVAGVVVGAYTLANGLSSPLLARIVDRRGQSVVLIPAGIALIASCAVDAAIPTSSSIGVLLLGAAVIGICIPPIAVASRSMWPFLLSDPNILEAAYVTDATFQELVFILGPLLVVAIAVLVGTGAAVVATGLLGGVGALLFATSSSSRRWRSSRKPGVRSRALASPGLRVLVLTMFALVAGFSATEVAIIAATRAAGHSGYSGVVLAVWSIGSLVGGLIYGSRRWPGSAATRVIVLLCASTVLTGSLTAVHAPLAIAIVMAFSGVNCAPALSGIYHSVQAVAPAGAVTESYSWISVGTLAGSTAGTSLAGILISRNGAGAGFALAGGLLAFATLVVLSGRRTLSPGTPRDAESLVPAAG
jgi:MFS family permease